MMNIKKNVIEHRYIYLQTKKNLYIRNASSVITAHNHPSGSLSPSDADRHSWRQINNSGEELGIKIIDNLIISKEGYYSQQQKIVSKHKEESEELER